MEIINIVLYGDNLIVVLMRISRELVKYFTHICTVSWYANIKIYVILFWDLRTLSFLFFEKTLKLNWIFLSAKHGQYCKALKSRFSRPLNLWSLLRSIILKHSLTFIYLLSAWFFFLLMKTCNLSPGFSLLFFLIRQSLHLLESVDLSPSVHYPKMTKPVLARYTFPHTLSFNVTMIHPLILSYPLLFTEGKRSHPKAHERIHDLQQAPSCAGSSETPKPGQPNGQQDTWGMVVCTWTQRKTKIPRSCFSGWQNRLTLVRCMFRQNNSFH